MDDRLRDKRTALTDLLLSYGRVLVAYSGGVDSTLLMAMAHETLGHDAVAVTAVSPSLARNELAGAKELASEHGWHHVTVATREMDREAYARNSSDRCYWCKTELFDVLAPLASERDARIVVGTNTDDLSDHRPGLRAAVERGIESPLVAAGLTKAEVRGLSRDFGLPTAEKPSSPCLASRVAYGVRVTPERLRRIEKAEASVRALGFACVRVRDHGAAASVEVGHDEVATALAQQETIVAKLNSFGYQDVSVDPRGYRMGSLNDLLIAAAPNH